YQNPFYLKKAQRIKPTLYDGIVIFAKHVAMPMIDDEETLILEEDSRSKISEKEKDPEAIKQNISHKPIDYKKLNRLTDDFGKRFTSQQELSAEQAFWLRMSNPTSKPSNASLFKIEAPKEIPKVSLVNESLKKLKFHLARFDNVVKIRTTPDACTESEWGFEHTKAVFNNEIILFLKSLKDIFNVFDRDLLNEIIELQDKDSTICKLKDIIKSMREKSKEENVKYDYCEIETKNVELEDSVAKLLSENERLCNEINHVKHVFKEQFDSIKKTRVRIKEQSDSLIDKLNLKSAENEDLKAQIQDKVFVITSLKNDLQKVKGKDIVDIVAQIPSANTIVPGMFKLDLETLAPSNIKQVESSNTSDSNTLALSSTGLKCSTSKCGSKPNGNKRNDRISQTPHAKLNANFDLNCATCKKSLFDDVHDKCLLDFVKTVNSHAKSAKKHEKQNIWKPTGSSKKAKIVESKNANHSEPNHTWGFNATDIPSSSSFVMTGCPNCSLISGLRMFETHDRESLSAHELC
ncbi:hypothetical protein Tco_1089334, partial [Tanacetum coccineum]